MIKVSVIIPAYNTAHCIVDTLNSITSQSLTDIEIIAINDGSKDNTLAVLNSYAAKDSRIRVFDQENRGVSATRNRGIKIATGEYVSFCDSDDQLDQDFLLNLYERAKSISADIYKGNLKLVDSCGHERVHVENSKIRTVDDFVGAWFSAIYRRRFLIDNEIYFPETIKYKEDTVFLFNAKLHCRTFAKCDDVFYKYFYQRTGSASNSVNDSAVLDAFKNLLIRAELLNKFQDEVYADLDKCRRGIVNNIFSYFENYKVSELSPTVSLAIAEVIRKTISLLPNNLARVDSLVNLSSEGILRRLSNADFNDFRFASDIKRALETPTSSVEFENLNIQSKFRLKVSVEDTSFETFLLPKKESKLYVFLSAVGKWDAPYPYFERNRWAADMPGMCLFVDDPTRVETQINIPYYFGKKTVDYKDKLLKLVKKLAAIHSIDSSDITFIGHSNGGFAAIYMSNKLPSSSCIAFAPQFSIKKYLDNAKGDYITFLNKFMISPDEESHFVDRLDLNFVTDGETDLKSKIFIYSNIASPCDVQQLKLVKEFHSSNKLKEGLYRFRGVTFWLVNIPCSRPHHCWPDQHISLFCEEVTMSDDVKTNSWLLHIIMEQMIKIQRAEDLKKEIELQHVQMKSKFQEILNNY